MLLSLLLINFLRSNEILRSNELEINYKLKML